MDEKERRARELDALENIVKELERLRVLKEHELGVRLEEAPEGRGPYVPKVEKEEEGSQVGVSFGACRPRHEEDGRRYRGSDSEAVAGGTHAVSGDPAARRRNRVQDSSG